MIAPRKLQSLGAPVQAVAAAVSSLRATVKITGGAGTSGLGELEAALRV